MTIQLVHLQPRYLEPHQSNLTDAEDTGKYSHWVEKPPISGPNVGPLSGPKAHIENANARYSSVTMSLTEPGEFATIALPAIAAKNRTTTTSARDVASAQGIYKIVNMNMVMI